MPFLSFASTGLAPYSQVRIKLRPWRPRQWSASGRGLAFCIRLMEHERDALPDIRDCQLYAWQPCADAGRVVRCGELLRYFLTSVHVHEVQLSLLKIGVSWICQTVLIHMHSHQASRDNAVQACDRPRESRCCAGAARDTFSKGYLVLSKLTAFGR